MIACPPQLPLAGVVPACSRVLRVLRVLRVVPRRCLGAVGALALGSAAVLGLTAPGDAAVRTDRAAPKEAQSTSGTSIPKSSIALTTTKIAVTEHAVAIAERPGDDTLYVVSKMGKIYRVRAGITVDSILDISGRVDTLNERGLLGLAFIPSRKDVLYIDYTRKNGNVVVSEVPFDGSKADIAKERVLLEIPKPFNEHNAGTLAVDTKGMLIISIGDGGGSGDKFNNAQNTQKLLGKLLRIDPTPSGTKPYSIPADNPYAKGVGKDGKKVLPEILAYGLRNPWRTTFDPATGDFWVPDVGERSFEEVNRMTPAMWGANFGWKLREGKSKFAGAKPKGAVDPVYDYPHLDGRCAITGGVLYRGAALKGLIGTYVLGDVCSGELIALRQKGGSWVPEDLGLKIPYLVGFGQLSSGEMVALSLEGDVFRLDPAS